MGSSVQIGSSKQPFLYTGAASCVPVYSLCLEDVDKLMKMIFVASSVNPKFFTSSLSATAKQSLVEQNVASDLI